MVGSEPEPQKVEGEIKEFEGFDATVILLLTSYHNYSTYIFSILGFEII